MFIILAGVVQRGADLTLVGHAIPAALQVEHVRLIGSKKRIRGDELLDLLE